MRRIVAASLTAYTMVGVGVACSSYGTQSAPEVTDAGMSTDGALPTTSDAAVDDAAPPIDASADGDAGATCDVSSPPGLFYSASMDDGTCEGWSMAGGMIEPVTSQARCGKGSCRVCVTSDAEAFLSRNLTTNEPAGTFELRFYARGDTSAGALNANMYFFDDAGAQIGFGSNVAQLTVGSWSSGQVIGNTTGTTTALLIRLISPPGSGSLCYYVDEFRLGRY